MGIFQNFIFLLISIRGGGEGCMIFSATFNNISVISWWKVFWWMKYEYPEKSTDLPYNTDKLYHIMLYHVLLPMSRI